LAVGFLLSRPANIAEAKIRDVAPKTARMADKERFRTRNFSLVQLTKIRYQSGKNFYNKDMARGWESKSVESQIDQAAENQSNNSKGPLNDSEKKARREREILLLARARVLQQLEASSNERYSESRRQALKELDEKLKNGS